MKKKSGKSKGVNIRLQRPSKQMINEVAQRNEGKVKLRIDHRTWILVHPDRLKKEGAQKCINDFLINYLR